MAGIVSDFLAWQDTFHGDDLSAYMGSHTEIPIFIVTAYLGLVFYGPELMKNRNPIALKIPFTLWNLLLAVFSIAGSAFTIPTFLDTIANKGFYTSVCEDPNKFYKNGASGFWVGLFILSKVPELFDTLFLVAQKKEVIFLHWFHHCTVMLYCWHAYVHSIGAGLWFATMNYSVHSLMYTYYFMQNIPVLKDIARKFARLITTLQLVQMVLGLVVIGSVFFFANIAGAPCAADASNIKMGLGMYLSYFVLFAFLYKRLYGKGGKKSKLAAGATATASTTGRSASPSGTSGASKPGEDGICNAAEDVMATLNANGKTKLA